MAKMAAPIRFCLRMRRCYILRALRWAALKRDEIGMNRHRALGYCLSMISSENRFTLCANAALRVRIML
ncbi:hypothetical protein [Bradyrhizobium diazoefficiens]|jgi:hypothetical protein|uniref:hypothetical protein n=1 Tax=Bradyrhizobium diazoefficiens TaxID=1355477 RepID=UPI00272BD31C|nr:hypothetical protein [Bradyrhizobium diazoefficiens]WLA68769.1 hypothetical protein QNN01_20205 [Bradyrhizobium diazoefficiens]